MTDAEMVEFLRWSNDPKRKARDRLKRKAENVVSIALMVLIIYWYWDTPVVSLGLWASAVLLAALVLYILAWWAWALFLGIIRAIGQAWRGE